MEHILKFIAAAGRVSRKMFLLFVIVTLIIFSSVYLWIAPLWLVKILEVCQIGYVFHCFVKLCTK